MLIYPYKEGKNWEDVFNVCLDKYLLPSRVYFDCHGELCVSLKKDDKFQALIPDANRLEEIFYLAGEAEFSPKKSWQRPVKDIIKEGLESSKWFPLCLIDFENKKVSSYIDYKIIDECFVEIGFLFSSPQYRASLKTRFLFLLILLRFFDKNIIACSVEGKFPKWLYKAYGFSPVKIIEGDRVDGANTVYYERRANSIVNAFK